MIEGNVFVYFGVIISKAEAYDLAKENKEDSIYDTCMANDLAVQLIGHNSYTSELIIGKEMFWNYSKGFMKLDLEEKVEISTLELEDDNRTTIPLTKEEEKEVHEKLMKIGIGGKPGYYVVSSFNVL